MIILTTPVQIPNITRIRVVDIEFLDSSSIAIVHIQVMSPPASGRTLNFRINVSDTGKSDLLMVHPNPLRFDDSVRVHNFQPATDGVYTRVEAAYRGGATKAAAYKAVESQLLADGVIDVALTGTVQ